MLTVAPTTARIGVFLDRHTMHYHHNDVRQPETAGSDTSQRTGADALLSDPHRKEGLSCAYVRAVAAVAGYAVSTPQPDLDGVDIQVRASGHMCPAIDIQLKSTTKLSKRGSSLRYSLKARNYNLLVKPSFTPRVLVVLDLPSDESEWLTISDVMILRRCAYWLSLMDREPTRNKSSVTILLPVGNIFNVDTLRDLMESARTRRLT